MRILRPGQVWRSNDPRDNGRTVMIVRVSMSGRVLVQNTRTGRQTTISEQAFLSGGHKGWTLAMEAQS